MILDTRNYQDSVESLVDKLKDAFVALGGQIGEVERIGQRTFERVTDRKFQSGIYVRISFEAESSVPKAIKDRFALDKTINRIMIEWCK
ncbi:MAG: 30S ribosomal protein S6 [Puniceicoccales bacterium]|jgi:ribosomal protein S6|nr:30S ribosomal protein S6 [Puniceicoccales bacterium]